MFFLFLAIFLLLRLYPGSFDAGLARLQRIFLRAGGVDRAADLVEHYSEVGYSHLVPSYAIYNWSWVQYYNADVKALLLSFVVLSVLFVNRIVVCCFCPILKQKHD